MSDDSAQTVPPDPPKPPPFKWTARKEQAARLLAEDAISDEKIAAKIGGSRRQLAAWKLHPEFAAKVKKIVAELGERSTRYVIGRRHRRVAKLDRMLRNLERVQKERAADPRMETIPGGTTGLIVVEESEAVVVKDAEGKDTPVSVPTEVAVDTGFVKEYRELLKQAAVETGQWTEKREVTGANGGAIPIQVVEVVRGPAKGDAK